MNTTGGLLADSIPAQDDRRAPSRRTLWVVLSSCMAAAAAVGAVSAYRNVLQMLADWEALLPLGGETGYVIGVRDWLPSATDLAALTVLSAAVGAQLLARRPWRSLMALSAVTAAIVVFDLMFFGLVWPSVVFIWIGTAAVWCATRWSASVAPPSLETDATAGRSLSDISTVPGDGSSAPAPHSGQADVIRTTRWVVTTVVVIVLVACGLLIAFAITGGLQLYFLDRRPDLYDLTYSSQAPLAALAIWGAWLAGRSPAARLRTTWLTAVLVGVALAAVDPLIYPTSGNLAVPVLVTCAVLVAGLRERLADRAAGALSP